MTTPINVSDNSELQKENSCEFVRELHGVKYYIDFNGNSPENTIQTLNAFDNRVILIIGGNDENTSYSPLGDCLVEKTKHLILMGQTSSMIELALMHKLVGKYRGENIRITHCSHLRQTVDCAFLSAKDGDIVLLSPSSASFDLFKDIDEYGKKYKEYVLNL